MHPEVYADGVGEITVTGTIVRVDLVSLAPKEHGEDNTPKSVLRQRLIFSLEGFANSVELMQKALRDLIEAGAVTRARAQPPSAAHLVPTNPEEPTAAAMKQPGLNASPNFAESRASRLHG